MKVIYKQNNLNALAQLVAAKTVRCLKYVYNSSKSCAPWNGAEVNSPGGSERCIEIPWAASAVTRCKGFWLDIGYAHAEPRYWASVNKGMYKYFRYSYGLDISPPKSSNPPLHSLVLANLIDDRIEDLPKFDLITCISTLEHVGCDNTLYQSNAKRREDPADIQCRVLVKMLGQLTKSGRLLVSLPYGKYQDNEWFLQYDDTILNKLKDCASRNGQCIVDERYYRAVPHGWRRSSPNELTNIVYESDKKRASGVVLLEFKG